MARAHATISEGASATSFFRETRGEIAMLAKGLATRALIWVRLCTISSSPGITAEPPVSKTCSTEVYWVDVKKNCTARWISRAAFSMKGRSTSVSYFSGTVSRRREPPAAQNMRLPPSCRDGLICGGWVSTRRPPPCPQNPRRYDDLLRDPRGRGQCQGAVFRAFRHFFPAALYGIDHG